MKTRRALLALALPLLLAAGASAQDTDYGIEAVPFNEVEISDPFWLKKIETNRTVTIPAAFAKCEETGRVENFVLAAKTLREGPQEGRKFLTVFSFDDTDIYKTIEGAAFSMAVRPDAELDRYVDSLIALVAAAQEPDGYLYTARTINPDAPHHWAGSARWELASELSHELYNSGHLFEAAVAHYRATGKRNFLDVALKNADLLVETFGPGKRAVAPGHEIVEMGLVRLYRVTGEKKYLDLAEFFIDCRGKPANPDRAYFQDHLPLVEQKEGQGHAVRAGYLYSGVADVAALTGNSAYLEAIDRIWENVVNKKLYVTGGIGAIHDGERFGPNFVLPNLTAYNETCAAIANVYWNHRMFLLHGHAKYYDVLERSLYNNVVSGVGMDGKTFFYPNPLSCDLNYRFNFGKTLGRQPWFDCSCCPTNLCRFMASVPGYVYAKKGESLYVNLYVSSATTVELDGQEVSLSQKSNYPWEGEIALKVEPKKRKADFALRLRLPGWARDEPVPSPLYRYLDEAEGRIVIEVNGQPVEYATVKGYAVLKRTWRRGDEVTLRLPMKARRVVADERVESDRGKVALTRGPLVYCLEGVDTDENVFNVVLPDASEVSARHDAETLGGVSVLEAEAVVFRPSADGLSILTERKRVQAIPYYAWSNRGLSRMNVWLPRKVSSLTIESGE